MSRFHWSSHNLVMWLLALFFWREGGWYRNKMKWNKGSHYVFLAKVNECGYGNATYVSSLKPQQVHIRKSLCFCGICIFPFCLIWGWWKAIISLAKRESGICILPLCLSRKRQLASLQKPFKFPLLCSLSFFQQLYKLHKSIMESQHLISASRKYKRHGPITNKKWQFELTSCVLGLPIPSMWWALSTLREFDRRTTPRIHPPITKRIFPSRRFFATHQTLLPTWWSKPCCNCRSKYRHHLINPYIYIYLRNVL